MTRPQQPSAASLPHGDHGKIAARSTAPGRGMRPLLALLAALLLGLPGSAMAYSVDGKIGVGFEETLVALGNGTFSVDAIPDVRAAGLGAWGWTGDFGWEAIVGMRALLLPNLPADVAGFITLGGHYNVFRSPRVNLSAGLRVDTGFARTVDAAGNAGAMRIGFGFEVPLRAVYFLSDQFSISGTVGPVLVINGSTANPFTGATNSTDFSLFRGGFGGGIGFTVWLR